jgi:SAM-dependent methyltransferase
MTELGPLFDEEETNDAEPIIEFAYGDAEYWEKRYAKSDTDFDWFFGWETLSTKIADFYRPTDRVLLLGCGNSRMPRDMLDIGFPLIASIDLSPTVIAQLQETYKGESRLQWFEMNCAKLGFPDQSFDLVIDKGTIDAIMCGDDCDELVNDTMSEAFRVLTDGGHFVCITFGSPGERFPAMRAVRRKWRVYPPIVMPPTDIIEDDGCDYIYIFEKRENLW